MDGHQHKSDQAHWVIAQSVFDKIHSSPNFIRKSWTNEELSEVFYSFRVEHLVAYQPQKWCGLSVQSIEFVFGAAGFVDTVVVLSPLDTLPLSSRLESALGAIAAIGRKELCGDCELIMTDKCFEFSVQIVSRLTLGDPTLIGQIKSLLAPFGVMIDN